MTATMGTPPGEVALQYAVSMLGKPYVYGGDSPSQGFDCSGLMYWAFLQQGTNITRTTDTQWANNTTLTTICDVYSNSSSIPSSIDQSQLQTGDLLYYFADSNSGGAAHVMMYAGGGNCIQAPQTGQNVDYTPLQFVSAASDEPFRGVKRCIGGGTPNSQANSPTNTGLGTGNNASVTGLTAQQVAQIQKQMSQLKDPTSNLPFSANFQGQIIQGVSGGSFGMPINPGSALTPGAQTFRPATQLVRGGIMELYAKKFKFYFMMNPQQISVEMAFNQNQLNPFQVKDFFQSGGYWVANQTVTFTVYFNRMYEVWQGNVGGPNGAPGPSGEGCRWDTRAVERLIGIFDAQANNGGAIGQGNNGWGDYPASMLPVQVAIGGPNSMQFQGYIASLDYTYTIFDSNMIPIECYIDIGIMRVYNPTESGADLTSALITSTGQVGPQKLANNQQFTAT
jgi:NlpC/P60 family